jgi:DNA-binding response OmpR family regulator
MSERVDAIVLDYHLGLLDGGVVAAEIKKVKPHVPIVMLTENVNLPGDALDSVDALVTKSDGAHFLLATVHFVLNVKPARRCGEGLRARKPIRFPRSGRSREGAGSASHTPQSVSDEKAVPFSPRVWRNIRNGTLEF